MAWQLDAAALVSADADWLVVGIPDSSDLSGPLAELDAALGNQLTRLRETGDVTGKLAEIVPLRGVQGLAKASRVLLVGLGPTDQLTEAGLHKAFITAVRQISSKEKQRVAVAIPAIANLTPAKVVSIIAAATQIGGLGQDLYRTERQRFPLENVQFLVQSTDDVAALSVAASEGTIIGEAVNLTRELVNEPPSVIFPISFAERAEKVARSVACGAKFSMKTG